MRLKLFTVVALAVAVILSLIACDGGNRPTGFSSGGSSGSVNTSLSDPATCAGPSGPFTSVIVTVSRVRAHTNANAPDNDNGFVDLTPANMTPVQVNLLAGPTQANPTQCILAQLATNIQIPSGTYQQFRIILLDNSQAQVLTNNLCGTGNGANCVVLTSDGSTHQITLSTEATTGIKLVGGQIPAGGFTVQAGQNSSLNLNFNACASIVSTGNQFRFKPVVHADNITSTTASINGRVVSSVTQAPISGGKTIVALEQRDGSGIDRILMETTPDGSSSFVFCPLAPGTYDVVVTAVDSNNVVFAATVTTGVSPGTNLGNIPIVAQPGSGTVASPATINGTVTTTGTNTSGNAIPKPADIMLSALQPVTVGTSTTLVTMPLAAQGVSMLTVITAAGGCPSPSTACANYALQVPAANPNVGAFASSGTTYTQNTTSPVSYTVDAQAFVPNTPATPGCAPSFTQVSTVPGGGPLVVTGGAAVTAAQLAFSVCQ